MKQFFKIISPRPVISFYHLLLAHLGAIRYGHPSRKMVTIGVTGTKGKSTTCYFIAKILEEAGYKVGMSSTAIFKVAEKEWLNPTKMTMPGRFSLQKLLRKMADAECQYAVVETSSEGILQYRHKGIDYDAAVFTNLTPEHIEAHGSFLNYKKAKGKLFAALRGSYRKKLFMLGQKRAINKISIVNLDDDYANYFLQFSVDRKIGYTVFDTRMPALDFILSAAHIKSAQTGVSFYLDSLMINLHLLGQFNTHNALAAIGTAYSQGIGYGVCKNALEKIQNIPGRQEFIKEGQPFGVVVDYAHEPASTKQLYEIIKLLPRKRVVQVFGSTGGGRDKRRRRVLGELAGEFADMTIVTTDDPYDDDPMEIINEVAEGAASKGKVLGKNLFKIADRRQAIAKAVDLAEAGDIVLITGKGCEQAIVGRGGVKTPWDDRRVVRELLQNKYKKY